MAQFVRIFLAMAYAALLVAAPCAYHRFQELRFRNFRVVTPGVLYRSGQLNAAGLDRVRQDYGIRTIISLRMQDGSKKMSSRWEEEYCRRNQLAHARISSHEWWADENAPMDTESVKRFLDVMRDPVRYPRPVLIHCFAGVERTGSYCAIYRMEFDGWSNQAALDELYQCGFTDLVRESKALSFLERYCPASKRSVTSASPKPR